MLNTRFHYEIILLPYEDHPLLKRIAEHQVPLKKTLK